MTTLVAWTSMIFCSQGSARFMTRRASDSQMSLHWRIVGAVTTTRESSSWSARQRPTTPLTVVL